MRAPAAAAPRQLPRLVMRRATAVALAVLLVAVALGGLRMAQDIDEEVAAARRLAAQMAALAALPLLDDAAALARLQALRAEAPLRHLRLRVRDGGGRVIYGAASVADGANEGATGGAMEGAAEGTERWTLPRPAGAPWTVELTASRDSERRESLVNLGGTLALLLLCIGGLLVAMRANMQRALRPLDGLLGAISAIGRQDMQPLRALPPMPVSELEAIAAALRHLAGSLDEAQAHRRLLGQQVLTLQEDERQRLAAELHDELGQRLTALRVDAAWLLKKLPEAAPEREVVLGMAAQCEALQQDVRALLARLQPFGPGHGGATDEAGAADDAETLARLAELLQALVASWRGGSRGVAMRLRLEGGPPQALRLPRPLALTLYRISQEALTNIVRHAQATQAELCLAVAAHEDGRCSVDWSVVDDGVGLPELRPALQHGNGLAGLHERVWALGSELIAAPARPGAARPGLQLAARFEFTPPPAPRREAFPA